MSCFRFLSQNYLDLDLIANNDKSSEQSAFPLTNAYNKNRRAKVWRSNGWYQVTSSNNVIIFRETTAGSDLTATITPGEYTRAEFIVAVKDAFDAAGDSTYTVSFTSNFKFSIASNGSGGAGDFELILSDILSTAYDLLGFDNVDLDGALTYIADSIRLHTSEWILADFGIDTDPKAFALIDARNSPLSITPTATVRLQGNHTNVWTSPVYDQVLSYDDRILHAISDTGLAGVALRYWRIYFVDQNPLGYVQVGAFFLGDTYQTIRGAPQFPFRNENIDRTDTVFSESSQTFSEIKPKTERFSLTWDALTIQEKEDIQYLFIKFGKGIPFFISMDTSIAFSTDQQYYIRYVKFADEPDFELRRPGIYRCTTVFEEQL